MQYLHSYLYSEVVWVKLVRQLRSVSRAVSVATYEWQASDSLLSVMNLAFLP